ncbi:nucleoside-diphosphate sugar epimerase [Solibacillus sp. FSL H8-0538]|uniref:nucleoside-diphosphate sugar epimerase n=1 Tax=Solibacillus sp. FSL H8-0538 TaxID=2921400 RepID=UPI0030F791A8
MLRLSWLISMSISLFGVMIIENFFTLSPEGQPGAGNLGAIGLALVMPFLLLSILTTYRFFLQVSRRSTDRMMGTIMLFFGFALIGVLVYYAIDYKNEAFAALGGNTNNPESTIYGYPLLNQYTNHIFINFYTFAVVHTTFALIGAIVGIFKPKKPPTLNEE